MSTLQQTIGAVLDECQQPDANTPPLRFIAMKIRDAAQELKHRATNVGFNWESREVPFTVGPSQDKVMLAQVGLTDRPSFVLTADPNDTRHNPRRIPIVDPQEVSQFWSGPQTVNGSAHLTQCFSFWREVGGVGYFRPHPMQDATLNYVLWVESGTIPQSLGDETLSSLGGFEAYLRIKAAMAVLPACEWSRLLGDAAAQTSPIEKMKAYALFRNPLLEALAGQLINWERVFQNYITNGWEQGAPVSVAYGDWAGSPSSWI